MAFAREFNEDLVHQVVTAYLAGPVAAPEPRKPRSDVSGGGKKPWRQKGTGRARAGTIRSPIWRSGGVTFAAKPAGSQPEGQPQDVPRVRLRSHHVRAGPSGSPGRGRGLGVEEPKTKLLVKQLAELRRRQCADRVDEVDENLYLASRNLQNVDVRDVDAVDPVSLLVTTRSW